MVKKIFVFFVLPLVQVDLLQPPLSQAPPLPVEKISAMVKRGRDDPADGGYILGRLMEEKEKLAPFLSMLPHCSRLLEVIFVWDRS